MIERRQFQQQSPCGQIKTMKNRFFIIKKDILPRLIGNGGIKAVTISQTLDQNGQGQRVAFAFLIHSVER